MDTVQKQTRSTGTRAIYFALSRFQTDYDLDRSSFLHDQSKSGSEYISSSRWSGITLSFEKRQKGSWNCRHSSKRARPPREFFVEIKISILKIGTLPGTLFQGNLGLFFFFFPFPFPVILNSGFPLRGCPHMMHRLF